MAYLIKILPPVARVFRRRVDLQLRGNSCRFYAPCLRVRAGFCTVLFGFLCPDGFVLRGTVVDGAHLSDQKLMESPGAAEHLVVSDLGIFHLFVLLFLRGFIPEAK